MLWSHFVVFVWGTARFVVDTTLRRMCISPQLFFSLLGVKRGVFLKIDPDCWRTCSTCPLPSRGLRFYQVVVFCFFPESLDIWRSKHPRTSDKSLAKRINTQIRSRYTLCRCILVSDTSGNGLERVDGSRVCQSQCRSPNNGKGIRCLRNLGRDAWTRYVVYREEVERKEGRMC